MWRFAAPVKGDAGGVIREWAGGWVGRHIYKRLSLKILITNTLGDILCEVKQLQGQ